jgi:CO dehydrogenase nickel-insertion accessory protein CooC1
LSDELKISIGRKMLVVNSCAPGVNDGLPVDIGMQADGWIPEDPGILDLSLAGRPIGELPASSAAYAALKELLKKIV